MPGLECFGRAGAEMALCWRRNGPQWRSWREGGGMLPWSPLTPDVAGIRTVRGKPRAFSGLLRPA